MTGTQDTGRTRASSAVLDASAVVRALVYRHPAAVEWLVRGSSGEASLHWPALLYVEVGSALVQLQRAGSLAGRDARQVVETALTMPGRAHDLRTLVRLAWAVALARTISVYDACYVVLAETLGAPLVTADGRLAAATDAAVLIEG
jgi:predicted nucleic acid-binding protein